LTIEGVFVYSTQRLPISGSSGKTLAFIEMNLFSRELEGMDKFLFFGDSDQDEYVLELDTGKYQVRDKQAISNVYEEFDEFDGILEFMLDMMLRRI
ncbi:SMI1/KNR4 family protein, partial [Pseudomonas syringae pv. actinidiae]|nr:SMI1/KNR4 family protein [Pseudomonas syringae pv. actinidiae]